MFGKIPARGDFVRVGTPSPVLEVVDELSQRALRSRSIDRPGPLYRAIFVPRRGAHAFVGALR
ncbi:TagF domain-containing protein, partial [Rubrivirga sp.]|uniref:TagF domain-containing protein n=1 Tax=Rubrivirga sp. TaxID=1885344 RepID=UPI003C778DB6